MSNKKQETSITEDLFSGLGGLIGSTIGLTAEVAKDVIVGVVYDMPKAIVAGFEEPKFSFSDDEPKEKTAYKNGKPITPADVKGEGIPDKVEPKAKVITKEEYRAQLQAELSRVDDAIKADDTVEVTITEPREA